MNPTPQPPAVAPTVASPVVFAASRDRFEVVLSFLAGGQAAALSHGELEERLQTEARELFCQMFQDHLDLRAHRETRIVEVTDAEGVPRPNAETGHERGLATIFGAVTVSRISYRAHGAPNLHPADAGLNLPTEKHSHGMRRLTAVEAARGSYQETARAIARATGQKVGKRQLEALAGRAAADFDAFYAQRRPPEGEPDDLLVLSCDGKGIVMRPDALRPATAAAAAKATPKLKTRLSKGEKRNRKRMAEVGAVYDATPVIRTPTEIMGTAETDHDDPAPASRAANKWLTASVEADTATVIAAIFDEAQRRDPTHQRPWIALVDGNRHQIERITAEATTRQVDLTIVIDFVHVLEYLWKAAWCFHPEADPAAEAWVKEKARAILAGGATRTAGAIRRTATNRNLTRTQRKGADDAAKYLTNLAPHLDYPTALANGWPIATGIIEGACRHLVKDRMDITGARWGLPGAEAVLKLRAIRCNNDFDDYWPYHLAQEQRRNHQARYANNVIPKAA